jgi:hypothetical protein
MLSIESVVSNVFANTLPADLPNAKETVSKQQKICVWMSVALLGGCESMLSNQSLHVLEVMLRSVMVMTEYRKGFSLSNLFDKTPFGEFRVKSQVICIIILTSFSFANATMAVFSPFCTRLEQLFAI